MFNPIREQIAENKIAQALAACGDLALKPSDRSRLISLRRRWDLLAEQAIAQTREERLLRLEENGVVEDLLKWLDQMEYAPEAKEEWSVKVTHTKQGGGAAAGAEKASEKGTAKWPWIGAAIIALLAAAWMLWPKPNEKTAATQTNREAIEVPAQEPPARSEPADTPGRTQSPTSPANPGKTKLNPGDLIATTPGKVDLTKIDPARVQLNPNVRLNSETLKKLAAANSLMTTGEQVDIAIAVYRSAKAPTKYDANMSKTLAAYLNRQIGTMDVAYNVLTQKFHDHEKRDRLFLKGRIDDKSLAASRARYLLLADVRDNSTSGKAYMRLCLYDVARGKGFTMGEASVTSAASKLSAKELYSFARKYLMDMKDRGILK